MGIKLTDSQLKAVDQMLQQAPYFLTASMLLIAGIADSKEQATILLHQYSRSTSFNVLYALTMMNGQGVLQTKFLEKEKAEHFVRQYHEHVLSIAVSAVYKEDIDIFEALAERDHNEELAKAMVETSQPITHSAGIQKQKKPVSVEVAFGNMKLEGGKKQEEKKQIEGKKVMTPKREEKKKEEVQVLLGSGRKGKGEEKKEKVEPKKPKPKQKKQMGSSIFTVDDDQGFNKDAKLLGSDSEEEVLEKPFEDKKKGKKGGKKKQKRDISEEPQKPRKQRREPSEDQETMKPSSEEQKESQEFVRVRKTKTEKETITVKDEKGYLVTKEVIQTKEYFVNVKKQATPSEKPQKKQPQPAKTQKSLNTYFKKQ